LNYLAAATEYVLERGWSVIPVTNDKRPALSSWEGYQRKRPSPKEFRAWFAEHQPAGIAIITGSISRLAVLDIDSHEVEQRFAAAFPDLLETRRVRTPGRSGLHLYFAIAAGSSVPSRKWAGADLKADGGYVVAPPTVFSSGQYLLELDSEPRLIAADELQQIVNWFEAEQQPDDLDASTLPITVTDAPTALALYQRSVSRYGSRAVGLFVTACQLRDRGWTAAAVEGSLAIAHVLMPHPAGLPSEPDEQRRKEAASAIRSAFKYPVRPVRTPRQENVIGVAYSDNSAREALLQLDLHQGTAFWRCYDALCIQGVQPGEVLSYGELYTTLCKFGIGRRAVDGFLSAMVDGVFLVDRTAAPSPPPPRATADCDPNHSDLKDFKNIEVHTTKRSLIRRGRRAEQRYAMPSLESLCVLLGVRRSPADPITKADVKTPSAYRRALQKALIQRRAGVYSLAVLAQRLGVSKRTIQRYNLSAGVQTQPTFATVEELSLSTLDDALHNVPSSGSSPYYIQNEYGDRYGARAETAQWLLGMGQRVWLMKRSFNWYWIGALPAALQTSLPCPVEDEQESEIRLRGERLWAISTSQELQSTGDIPPQSILATPIHIERPALPIQTHEAPTPKPPHRRTRRFYRKPLAAPYEEWAAKKVYEMKTGLSLVNARRLVDTYGVDAVMKAADRTRALLTAGKLSSPGGFIITTTQMYWRKLYPAHRLHTPKFTPDRRKVKSA
jgi:hypothetical protein